LKIRYRHTISSYDVESRDIFSVSYLISCLYAGGLFHYNKDSTAYGLTGEDGMPLYRCTDDDPLINDLGIYILDKLGSFQNMSDVYKVTAETDLHDYVGGNTKIVDGTKIYRFSKELLAYLEMCVAFSPYYRQDDPRTAGAMDMFYREALQAYADVPYKDLHAYLERRFDAWYTKFKPASSAVVSVEDAELGDVVSVGDGDGAAPPTKKPRYSLTLGAGSAAPAAPPPAPGGEEASSDGNVSGERTGTSSPTVV
jgi:hypothetical protein